LPTIATAKAANTDAKVILFTTDPLVGSGVGEGELPAAAVGEGSVGVMSFVGTAAPVGTNVPAVVTEGCGDSDGAGDVVTSVVGAPEEARDKVGTALSATVGMSPGAGLEVGELVMLQSAASIVELMSGMVRISAVQPPSAQVYPREQAFLSPIDSSGSQMPMGWGSSSHKRNN
jgi:hypothetical protein